MVTEPSSVGLFSGLKGHHKSAQGRAKRHQQRSAALGSAYVEIVSPVKGVTKRYQ